MVNITVGKLIEILQTLNPNSPIRISVEPNYDKHSDEGFSVMEEVTMEEGPSVIYIIDRGRKMYLKGKEKGVSGWKRIDI